MRSIAAVTEPSTPRRGRPPIYRDASQKKEGARLRKQRQRDRERAAGLQTAELRLPSAALTTLTKCALVTFTDPKDLAGRLIEKLLPSLQREIEQLEERAGALWQKAQPFIHHGHALQEPGSRVRANGRTITHSEWGAVSKELAAFRAELAAEGWPDWRIDRFMRRSAERLSLHARRG